MLTKFFTYVRRYLGNRGTAEKRLNTYDDSWPLLPEYSPCDVHFIAYLKEYQVRNKRIFHFGSGEHHILGKQNLMIDEPNEILAVTLSRKEYIAYIDYVTEVPSALRCYKVLFADIYTITPRLISDFDIVTLFHLGEFHTPLNETYAPLDDRSLLDLFVENMQTGGQIFFYTGSLGFSKAEPLLARQVHEGRLKTPDNYRSLLICELP